MAATLKTSVEIQAELLERTRRAARERGIAVPQLVQDALEHELSESSRFEEPHPGEGEQPQGVRVQGMTQVCC